MEVKEGTGAKPGSYFGRFKEFIKTRGAVPSYVHNTKNGPVVRYVIVDDEGVEVPGSFPLDFTHYLCQNTLGCFGTPARAVEPLTKQMKMSQLFPQLEKKIQQVGARVKVWIPDNSEWIASISPIEGVFPVRFEAITSKDKDTGKPIHVRKTGTRSGKGGKSYTYDDDRFTTVLRIDSGQHEGASFLYILDYMIKKDGATYYVDKSGRKGKAFYDFCKYHGVDLSRVNPKSAADPDNILPELQARFKKNNVLMSAEVAGGWVESLTLVPMTSHVDVLDLEGEDPKPRRRKSVKTGKVINTKKSAQPDQTESAKSVVRAVINKESGKTVFDVDGTLSLKSTYMAMVKRNKLPRKMLDKYTIKDCIEALILLGYDNLASNYTGVKKAK